MSSARDLRALLTAVVVRGNTVNKIKDWAKSPLGIPIVSGVVITAFSFCLSIVRDYYKQIPFLSTVRYLLNSFFGISVKLWSVLLIALLIAVLLRGRAALVSKLSSPPDFLEYTSDNIASYNWTWSWTKGLDGKYRIDNLRLVCPECGTPLTDFLVTYNQVTCLRCDLSTFITTIPHLENIETIIIDNVDRSLYKIKDE